MCAGVALWANLHAGAFIAPVLLGLRGRRRGDGPHRGSRRLSLASLGAAAALFATPIGFGLVRYLRLHLTLPALHPVDEFRSPGWLSDPALVVFAAAFLASLVVGRRRMAMTVGLPVLVMVLLAQRSVRFGADAALAAAPYSPRT